MTYGELYQKAINRLSIPEEAINDWRPAGTLFIPELKEDMTNAIIIWLKSGESVIFIDDVDQKD